MKKLCNWLFDNLESMCVVWCLIMLLLLMSITTVLVLWVIYEGIKYVL